jgi:hypothetical protein
MARRRCIIVLWLYLLLLKVKSDNVNDVNMDTSALFHSGNDVFGDNLHAGDLNVGENLVDDKDGDIVLTVGELVKMYNNEEHTENNDLDVEIINPDYAGKQKFERLKTNKGSKQTQSELTVDFRDVAGRRGIL